MGKTGGRSIQETTRRILSRLMSNGVARQYNWKGRPPKNSFKSLQLKNVVLDAVRRNVATARACDADIEAIIKDWLRFSGDRSGGRRRREGIVQSTK